MGKHCLLVLLKTKTILPAMEMSQALSKIMNLPIYIHIYVYPYIAIYIYTSILCHIAIFFFSNDQMNWQRIHSFRTAGTRQCCWAQTFFWNKPPIWLAFGGKHRKEARAHCTAIPPSARRLSRLADPQDNPDALPLLCSFTLATGSCFAWKLLKLRIMFPSASQRCFLQLWSPSWGFL